MRAKAIYESINFERGKDPRKSMGIGRFAKEYKAIKDSWMDGGADLENDVEFIEETEYKNIPIVLIKETPLSQEGNGKVHLPYYVAVAYFPNGDIDDGGYYSTPGYAWKRICDNIDWKTDKFMDEFNESVSSSKILTLEDLAEITARTQDPDSRKLSERVFLKFYKRVLETKGDGGIIKAFQKATDLRLKTIIRGKYVIVYDQDY